MCASKRQKKSKRTSLASTSQQPELWWRHRDCLSHEQRETIERETAAARAAGGSRLAAALHLLVVRRILCGDATNPKQKKLWSAYLAVNLPGFSISRAQVFKDIKAAEAAQQIFPAMFLDEVINGGYALNVRPTVEEPLGKFTTACKAVLTKVSQDELNDRKACQTVLAEAVAIIKAEAKRNRPNKTSLSADDKRERILAEIHNSVVRRIEELSKAIEPGDSYTSMNVRDDLELIFGRIMTGTQTDAVEVEPRQLPEGFEQLSLPGSALDSSVDAANQVASAAIAA